MGQDRCPVLPHEAEFGRVRAVSEISRRGTMNQKVRVSDAGMTWVRSVDGSAGV